MREILAKEGVFRIHRELLWPNHNKANNLTNEWVKWAAFGAAANTRLGTAAYLLACLGLSSLLVCLGDVLAVPALVLVLASCSFTVWEAADNDLCAWVPATLLGNPE